MTRLLLFLLSIMTPCRSLILFEPPSRGLERNSDKALPDFLSSSECTNPCWLGIEVGVTNRADAIAILEEHNIDYDTRGVIHLYNMPDSLLLGIDPDGRPSPYGRIFGNINVGERNEYLVQSMNFALDICVSTVVAMYGTPSVWHVDGGVPSTIIYLDHSLFFDIDVETLRIVGVYLHMNESMPSPDELDNWSKYDGLFSEGCTDIFTESGE